MRPRKRSFGRGNAQRDASSSATMEQRRVPPSCPGLPSPTISQSTVSGRRATPRRKAPPSSEAAPPPPPSPTSSVSDSISALLQVYEAVCQDRGHGCGPGSLSMCTPSGRANRLQREARKLPMFSSPSSCTIDSELAVREALRCSTRGRAVLQDAAFLDRGGDLLHSGELRAARPRGSACPTYSAASSNGWFRRAPARSGFPLGHRRRRGAVDAEVDHRTGAGQRDSASCWPPTLKLTGSPSPP